MVRFYHPVRCGLPEAKIQLVKIYFVVSMVRFAGPVVMRPVRLKIQQCWIFTAPDCGWPRGNSPMTSHDGVFPLAARVNNLLSSAIIESTRETSLDLVQAPGPDYYTRPAPPFSSEYYGSNIGVFFYLFSV